MHQKMSEIKLIDFKKIYTIVSYYFFVWWVISEHPDKVIFRLHVKYLLETNLPDKY
jgi:hypothetical protein